MWELWAHIGASSRLAGVSSSKLPQQAAPSDKFSGRRIFSRPRYPFWVPGRAPLRGLLLLRLELEAGALAGGALDSLVVQL